MAAQSGSSEAADPQPLQKTGSTYKKELDQAAIRAHKKEIEEEEKSHESIVQKTLETVAHYVPPVGKLLHLDKEEGEAQVAAKGGPPERPTHDTQIEEFLRDQHRSMTQSGQMEGGDPKTSDS